MALFNKEPDKSVKPAQPQPQWPDKSAPATSTTVIADDKPAAKSVIAPAPAEARAYLDRGSRISGKLTFDGAARIDGQVDGEITAKESLVIGETAVITAQINATAVVVAGKVSGDISATQRLEIRPSARVVGNLASPLLVIHEGATFEGHCTMQVESGRDDRKVTVFPKEERLAQAGGHKQA
ncbi:MAG TPA: polymer-forming cytoskeletal protein [Candidatus Binataceae bacterium]|nr:polymer-forming cytoskeletal protein [Candidatus Binataceae bacterium]HVB81696.1 polymer-forming cytoskeletal protein [Candidatus Binataceae bacterium]